MWYVLGTKYFNQVRYTNQVGTIVVLNRYDMCEGLLIKIILLPRGTSLVLSGYYIYVTRYKLGTFLVSRKHTQYIPNTYPIHTQYIPDICISNTYPIHTQYIPNTYPIHT
jgi:hypothetical protein